VLIKEEKTFHLRFAQYLFYSIFQAIYNITLHPLSKYPGPKLRGAFYISNSIDVLTGDVPQQCLKLHEQYGDVVRINPNTVSFVKPEAWRGNYFNFSSIECYFRATNLG
jgi:hypothetical protein